LSILTLEVEKADISTVEVEKEAITAIFGTLYLWIGFSLQDKTSRESSTQYDPSLQTSFRCRY
jgi:hypothetical protein